MYKNSHASKSSWQTLVSVVMVLTAVFMLFNNVLAHNWASTTLEVTSSCDGTTLDPGEVCDGLNFGSTTCASFTDAHGQPFQSGKLLCSADCQAISTSSCYTCGNGIKEDAEACDTNDFGSVSICANEPFNYTGTSSAHCACLVAGLNTGEALCTNACKVDRSKPHCDSVGLTEPGSQGSQGGGSGGGGSAGGGGGGYPPGFVPGSDLPPKETKLIIIGKAYPGATVNILVDGKAFTTVLADANADYHFETNDKLKVTPGVLTLSVWADDAKGQRSAIFTATFRVASGAVTTISGANLSPTIQLDKTAIIKGDKLQVFGQSVPTGQILVSFMGKKEVQANTTSSDKGVWLLNYDTSNLETDTSYLVKALFDQKLGSTSAKSGYSKALSLQVGKAGGGSGTGACPGADLNHDKKVNLVDFSILLYYWGSNNACADQNHNGKVDLTDFSIMLYNWTG